MSDEKGKNTGRGVMAGTTGRNAADDQTGDLTPEVRRYADIIGLSHPVSVKHRQMSMSDRAAQFSPFAALTGYGDMIDNTADAYADQVAHEILLEATEEI